MKNALYYLNNLSTKEGKSKRQLMKKWLAVGLSLNLIGFYFLNNNLTYANDEDKESPIQSLKQEIKREESFIRALKKRYQSILREKQRFQSIIEQEKQRIKQIDKGRRDNLRHLQKEFTEAERLKEEERQLTLLEAIKQEGERLRQLEKRKH